MATSDESVWRAGAKALQARKKSNGNFQFWEPYRDHSNTFRNWMIAYGIAVPYLFISQKDFAAILKTSANVDLIIKTLFGGVIVQLLSLMWSKYSMMILYTGEAVPGFRTSRLHKFFNKATEKIWPFVIFDIGTILLYFIGTTLLFLALVPEAISTVQSENKSVPASSSASVSSAAKPSASTPK